MRSAPPTITTSRNRIDWKNGKDSGLTKSLIEREDDARDAGQRPPRCVNATVRIEQSDRGRSTARDLGIAHGAHREAPRARGEPGVEPEASAASAAGPARDLALGELAADQARVGMPIRPFQPPVRRSHSTAPYSTMKPKAIVTMAR